MLSTSTFMGDPPLARKLEHSFILVHSPCLWLFSLRHLPSLSLSLSLPPSLSLSLSLPKASLLTPSLFLFFFVFTCYFAVACRCSVMPCCHQALIAGQNFRLQSVVPYGRIVIRALETAPWCLFLDVQE